MKRDYELIVFDWDGTLMDSRARIVVCMQAGFRSAGFDVPSDEAVAALIGLGLDEVVHRLSPDCSTQQQKTIADAYRTHFFTNTETPSCLFEGAVETLEILKDAGLQLAIATGKSRRGLEKDLDDAGVRELFDFSRCADETRSKPHPDMLEEIMDRLGVLAAKTLMVGDTDFDMHMANNAGADALAVSYGVHDRERLLQTQPAGVIDAVSHIPDWLVRNTMH